MSWVIKADTPDYGSSIVNENVPPIALEYRETQMNGRSYWTVGIEGLTLRSPDGQAQRFNSYLAANKWMNDPDHREEIEAYAEKGRSQP